MKAPQVALF